MYWDWVLYFFCVSIEWDIGFEIVFFFWKIGLVFNIFTFLTSSFPKKKRLWRRENNKKKLPSLPHPQKKKIWPKRTGIGYCFVISTYWKIGFWKFCENCGRFFSIFIFLWNDFFVNKRRIFWFIGQLFEPAGHPPVAAGPVQEEGGGGGDEPPPKKKVSFAADEEIPPNSSEQTTTTTTRITTSDQPTTSTTTTTTTTTTKTTVEKKPPPSKME